MHKYAIVIAAVVVVLASLANSVPATNSAQIAANKHDQMTAEATNAHKNRHVKAETRSLFDNYNGQSNNGNGLLESGISGVVNAVNVSKNFGSGLIGKAVGFFQTIDLKKLIKIALVGGAVVLFGAVAAAAAAGISAVVAMVSAGLPYFNFFFGGHKGEATESEMEVISEFVLNAFNKYEGQQYKA